MTNQAIESAQIIRRSGSIADLPPRFSLSDMLLGQSSFINPPEYRIGTPKADKWCKGCKTNHPYEHFVMDDGSISKDYCKPERLRILEKKNQKQMEAQKKKDEKLNKRRPMPICELSKVF
ncbi:MAG TPA: hypothetical protein VFM18_00885 [Methanosarcina sp.]|nr:hypothetical protein [Methanosarcina sp.]